MSSWFGEKLLPKSRLGSDWYGNLWLPHATCIFMGTCACTHTHEHKHTHTQNKQAEGGDVAQWLKVLFTKTDNLSLSFRPYVMKAESWLHGLYSDPHVCAVVGKHLNSYTHVIMHTYIVEKSTVSCHSHLLQCSCSHGNVSLQCCRKAHFNSGLWMTRIQASNGLAWLGSSRNIATNFMSFLIFPVVIDKDLPRRAKCRHWLPRTLSFPTLRQTLLFLYSRISYLPASASKILAWQVYVTLNTLIFQATQLFLEASIFS